MDNSIENTLQGLKKNNIAAEYYEDSAAAVEAILAEVAVDQSIGIGGSVTVQSLNLAELFIERGNQVFFHWLEKTPQEMNRARKRAHNADIYLSSTNALTENGELVNIDGFGNRVASMIHGPGKVLIICGKNKIVKDISAAMKHIKANAYQNARRLNLKTPCAVTGTCNDCDSPQRMCSVTTIIEKKPGGSDLKVMIIGEELGY